MGKNYYEQRGKYADAELVECYLRHHSQTKAAEELGVGRETVARAVRRKGIRMDGRKHCNGKSQKGRKITDEQLRQEAETLTAQEISRLHSMSVERVLRRAKKIDISLKTREFGGHWKTRADFYGCAVFDESITLKSLYNRDGGICQICGKLTDWNNLKNGHIGKTYPTLDHITPLSKGGTHTWDNVQLAHMGCNAGKCDKLIREE